MPLGTLALLGAGYAASVPVIVRFVPVVRERRWRWLAVHHLGVVTLVVVSVSSGRALPVAANSAWLVVSTAWYAVGGRRSRAASRT